MFKWPFNVLFVEKKKERRMKGRDLIQAVERNNEEEVLRLIDERHVDINYQDVVSLSYSLCFFLNGFD